MVSSERWHNVTTKIMRFIPALFMNSVMQRAFDTQSPSPNQDVSHDPLSNATPKQCI
jgi:hypothetical protein